MGEGWVTEMVTGAGLVTRTWQGEIYESGEERAALAGPIWVCGHEHDHPATAKACADVELDRRRRG